MKKIISILMVMVLTLSMVACGKKENEGEYKVYYVSTDKLSIIPISYDYESTTISDMIREALGVLSEETNELSYMRTIPSGVEIQEWDISEGSLSLYLSREYMDMDTFTEVLVRSAMVKTLVQIPGVDSVAFYIDNQPLQNAAGEAIGIMTSEMFIDDFGDETDSLFFTTLTLYFANGDGATIVAESRDVYYSSNVSLEKLVIDQLLKGPETDRLLSTIPTGTKLLSVSVTDGVAYVNFDATFETQISGVSEKATIYSIVDSLTELTGVSQVQLLVNGETPHMSNLDIELTSAINRNTDIIYDATASMDFVSDIYKTDEQDEQD